MSAFLGPIHYWLYGKVEVHEKLIEAISELAKSKGYDTASVLNEGYVKYGKPVQGALEDAIEHGNIHGWLQESIISVESRLAYTVTQLLKEGILSQGEIEDVFYNHATQAMKALNMEEDTPQVYYKLIYDYMLEGMPCDRINEVLESNENEIVWRATADIHKSYWDQVGGDVAYFNTFRNTWIRGFLEASGKKLTYHVTEDGMHTITK